MLWYEEWRSAQVTRKYTQAIVTHFIDVCFKETLVLLPLRWRDNDAEICRGYIKDNAHKL